VIPELVVLAGIVVVVAAEVVLRRLVRRGRGVFQWLVTEEDEVPALDAERLASFLAGTFSPELGWEPVPGATGEDRAGEVVARFRIDEVGARRAPDGAPAPTVAAFGDSYVFCRQVDDDETWASVIGRDHGIGVMNLGVGNYGVDQALLRYRRTTLPDTVTTIVVGFVPETICRVASVWKHWMEFGNTFGFKPRFVLDGDELVLEDNPVRSAADFADLARIVAAIGERDPFRASRFRSLQFRGSYLVSFLRHPVRHASVLIAVTRGRLDTPDGPRLAPAAFDRAFARIMRDNIRASHRAYRDAASRALLVAILDRFAHDARERGHDVLVCVIPQLFDLVEARGAESSYRPFYRDLADRLPVVDATDALRAHPIASLYVHDRYGGHLSPFGNRVVAEVIATALASTTHGTHAVGERHEERG